MGSVPREILKWLLSLDLSYSVKNVRRDFANGFLFAEVLSRYYPADIQMHSFENVTSLARKKQNWSLLEKLFKKKRISIERQQIDAVMNAEGDAAVDMLQLLYSFINGPEYEATKAPEATFNPDRMEQLSQPRDPSAAARAGDSDDEAEPQGYAFNYSQGPGMGQGYAAYGAPMGGLSQAPMYIPMQQAAVGGGRHVEPARQRGAAHQNAQQEDPLFASPLQQPAAPMMMGMMGAGMGMGMGMAGAAAFPARHSSSSSATVPTAMPGYGYSYGYGAPAAAASGYGAPGSGYGYAAQVPAPMPAAQAPGAMPAVAQRFVSPGKPPGAGSASKAAPTKARAPSAPRRAQNNGGGQSYVSANSGGAPAAAPAGAAAHGYSAMQGGMSPGVLAGGGYALQGGGYAANMGGDGYAAQAAGGYAAQAQAAGGYAAQASGYAAQAGGYAGQAQAQAAGGYAAQAGGYAGQAAAAGGYAAQYSGAGAAGGGYGAMLGGYGSSQGGVGLSPGRSQGPSPGREGSQGDIPHSKQRPVDFQPYGMRDFEDKEYNVKRAGGGYWQLGRLGPDLETEELQAKREKAERIKTMGNQVREENMRKAAVAAAKPKREVAKEPTAREKALQFAKNIPKPEIRQSPSPGEPGARGRAPAGKAGSAGSSSSANKAAAKKSGGKGAGGSENSQLAALEAQHAADQRRVDQIRAELARML